VAVTYRGNAVCVSGWCDYTESKLTGDYSYSDKFLAQPGRKQANIYVRMA